MLANGLSPEQIIEELPDLELADVEACLRFASRRRNRVETMNNFFARSVFFVKDAERSLRFYTETLGFSLEWNHQVQGRAFVFEVSLLGFQLILNQTEPGRRIGRVTAACSLASMTTKYMHFANTSTKKGSRQPFSSGVLQHL